MDPIRGLPEIGGIEALRPAPGRGAAEGFAEMLAEAMRAVDRLQRESDAAQQALAAGDDVELHEVLIKIEEAEVAFKIMMEVRNKLVDAYREIMRMGG